MEYHFNSDLGIPGEYLWVNDVNLYDVYENSKYGEFSENNYTHTKPTFSTGKDVITCEVYGTKCKASDEFYKIVGPYMND